MGEQSRHREREAGTPVSETNSRLFYLRQGNRSAAEYSVNFHILATRSGWNSPALRRAFLNGLSERMKDLLAARDEPESLDSLIETTIDLDNRIRERERGRSLRSSPSSRSCPPPPRVSAPSPSQPRSISPPAPPSPPPPEPMQLGRARLSPEERECRRLPGVCIYCRNPGHFISSCPVRPKESARQ